MDGRTPGYLMREELQREKLRGRAGKRAWAFENRLREGKGSSLARRCWEKMKERTRQGKASSDWENERKMFFEDRELELEEVKRRREEGDLSYREIWEKTRG